MILSDSISNEQISHQRSVQTSVVKRLVVLDILGLAPTKLASLRIPRAQQCISNMEEFAVMYD